MAQPRLGPIMTVTVVVPDLDLAARSYTRLLAAEVLAEERLGPAAATAWAAPALADARTVLVGPPGAGTGLVQLVEDATAVRPPPFRTLGWAALEVLVTDADEALERCREATGFDVLQPPAGVGSEASSLRALQAAGPGGEGVYLTEIRRPPAGFDLPDPARAASRTYAVVAASDDLVATRAHFASRFALHHVTDHPLPVRVINRAFGLAAGSAHRVSTLQLAGSALLEVDQYPPEAVPRVRRPGHLTPGIAGVTFGSALPPERTCAVAPPGLPYLTAAAV